MTTTLTRPSCEGEGANEAPFNKAPDFHFHTALPFNGGPPPASLALHPVTPTDHFFVRNHGNIPQPDPAQFRLTVRGLVSKAISVSLWDLRTKFRAVTRRALLQCAGLRRTELRAVRPIPHELPWGIEPLAVAEWTGVRLADLLDAAGPAAEAKHVEFTGLDRVERNGDIFGFGGSIPLEKALAGEVLLAYVMTASRSRRCTATRCAPSCPVTSARAP